ncbi:hypothetical protein [Streptomyces palmae]|uniref:DUF308 domain-containing protein n=1 Tax=Streptomyces palmae TaxID=1701085 RepID=A0A4Z0G6I6_9ACTN|nr:hypothetical protein [Streptomyces palmae]TGA90330.1 hypothetical protein E4099_28780 [Streptomyces palmae]
MAERDADGTGARDDDAAFAEIVAAYGPEPPDPPGAEPWPHTTGVRKEVAPTGGRTGQDAGPDGEEASGEPEAEQRPARTERPGSFVVFAPGVGGAGPRDWQPAEPSEDDFDETDEGHFVPPDPPLPQLDITARFAWLAVLGGPLLLLVVVLFRLEMTWWMATLGVGGFLGGFATLVMRMKSGDDEDEDEDPGRGAVV